MKLSLGTTLILAGLLSAGQAIGQDAKLQEELKKFEGNWQFESIKMSGKDLPATELEKFSVLKIKGKEMHVTNPEGEEIKVEFELDLNSTPALIDFTSKDGDRDTFEGIYKFEKGKLFLCASLDPSAKERPAEFNSPEGSKIILEVLRRSEE